MAAAATLDRFEARTHDALAGVTRVCRAVRDAGAHGQLLVSEVLTSFLLRRLLGLLTHQWLVTLSSEDAEVAARHLGELYQKLGQLIQLGDMKGLSTARVHRPFFRQAMNVRDQVGDLLESIHLGLNDELRQLIAECMTGVKDRRDRPDWRSSLAAMRD